MLRFGVEFLPKESLARVGTQTEFVPFLPRISRAWSRYSYKADSGKNSIPNILKKGRLGLVGFITKSLQALHADARRQCGFRAGSAGRARRHQALLVLRSHGYMLQRIS